MTASFLNLSFMKIFMFEISQNFELVSEMASAFFYYYLQIYQKWKKTDQAGYRSWKI